MMKFLEGEELTVEEIKTQIRKETIANRMVPMFCGSAYKNKGVQMMLDGVVDYMPSPLDIPPITGVNPETGEEEERVSDDNGPLSALAFKIVADPFVGKLAYFRVYSGTLEAGSYVYNSSKGKKERIGRILQMHANKREEIEKVYSGDIAAAVGLKDTTTGDTLCDEKNEIILESMEFPEPVIEIAIEPKTKAGQEKMGIALAKLAEEDPTFKTYTNPETGQTIIAGMGELHLEIIVDRLLREFKVEANVGKPQVSYKETVTREVEVDNKYVKYGAFHRDVLDPVLKEMKKLSINLVDQALLPKADYVGSVSGAKVDKSAVFPYSLTETGAPIIDSSPLAVDCTVVDIYETPNFESFICSIDGTYVEEKHLNEAGKDYHTLKPILFEFPTYEYLATGEVLGKCLSFKENREG